MFAGIDQGLGIPWFLSYDMYHHVLSFSHGNLVNTQFFYSIITCGKENSFWAFILADPWFLRRAFPCQPSLCMSSKWSHGIWAFACHPSDPMVSEHLHVIRATQWYLSLCMSPQPPHDTWALACSPSHPMISQPLHVPRATPWYLILCMSSEPPHDIWAFTCHPSHISEPALGF